MMLYGNSINHEFKWISVGLSNDFHLSPRSFIRDPTPFTNPLKKCPRRSEQQTRYCLFPALLWRASGSVCCARCLAKRKASTELIAHVSDVASAEAPSALGMLRTSALSLHRVSFPRRSAFKRRQFMAVQRPKLIPGMSAYFMPALWELTVD